MDRSGISKQRKLRSVADLLLARSKDGLTHTLLFHFWFRFHFGRSSGSLESSVSSLLLFHFSSLFHLTPCTSNVEGQSHMARINALASIKDKYQSLDLFKIIKRRHARRHRFWSKAGQTSAVVPNHQIERFRVGTAQLAATNLGSASLSASPCHLAIVFHRWFSLHFCSLRATPGASSLLAAFRRR